MHCSKFNCGLLYSIKALNEKQKDNDWVKVQNIQEMSEKDLKSLSERINIKVKNGMLTNNSSKECVHIYSSNNIDAMIDGENVRCGKCDLTENLWICMECGFIGCGRVQPMIKGNGHALEHYEKSALEFQEGCVQLDLESIKQIHGQSVLISSIGKEDSPETFCYICQDFVQNPHKLNIKYVNPRHKSFNDLIEDESERTKSDPTSIPGIVNEGQTCYVSSALHLLGEILKDVDFSEHVLLCESQPSKCMLCQLIKVFNRLKNGKNGSIRVTGLLKTIYSQQVFTKGRQEDCSEFLQFIFGQLETYEKCGLIPNISELFQIEIESEVACDSCEIKNNCIETYNMLYVPISKSLDESIKEYLRPKHSNCACKGILTHVSRISKVPDFLVVTVMRYKIEDKKSIKIEDPIEASVVDLGTLMDCHDYRLKVRGCIAHKGKEIGLGHYVWWVDTENGLFLANDVVVTKRTEKSNDFSDTIFLLNKA